jgi:hypothetical protein
MQTFSQAPVEMPLTEQGTSSEQTFYSLRRNGDKFKKIVVGEFSELEIG